MLAVARQPRGASGTKKQSLSRSAGACHRERCQISSNQPVESTRALLILYPMDFAQISSRRRAVDDKQRHLVRVPSVRVKLHERAMENVVVHKFKQFAICPDDTVIGCRASAHSISIGRTRAAARRPIL